MEVVGGGVAMAAAVVAAAVVAVAVVVVVVVAAAAAAAVEVGSRVAVMASRTVLAGHFPPPLCARHGPSPGERRRGGSAA